MGAWPAAVAFFATAVLLLVLRRPAQHAGFVDNPGGRKQHHSAVPLIGGAVLFVTYAALFPWLDAAIAPRLPLLAGMALLVAVGCIDDYREIRSTTKLVFQILAAAFMVSWGGVVLIDAGQYPLIGTLELAGWAIPVTMLAVVGLINGVNMLDGADGLAGGTSLVAFVWLAVVAGVTGNSSILTLMVPLLGALPGFLLFNMRNPWRRKASVFLGDAGSMMLGLMLAWFLVALAGAQAVVSPVGLAWIVALPVIDTLSLMARRIQKGQSPFAPDREHLHHIFQRAGYGPGQTTGLLCLLAAGLGGIGVSGSLLGVPDAILLGGLLLVGALHFVFIKAAWRTMKALRRVGSQPSALLGAGQGQCPGVPAVGCYPRKLALVGFYGAIAMVPFSNTGVMAGFALVLGATLWAAPAFWRDAKRLGVAWVVSGLSLYLVMRGALATETAGSGGGTHWLDIARVAGLLSLPLAWWLGQERRHWRGLFVTLLVAAAGGLAWRVDWAAVKSGQLANPFAWGDPATSGFISTGVILLVLAGMMGAARRLGGGWRHRFQLGCCLLLIVPLVFLLVASQYATAWLGLLVGAFVLAAASVWHGLNQRQWTGLLSSLAIVGGLWLAFWVGLEAADDHQAELADPLRAGVLLLQGEPGTAERMHAATVQRMDLWGSSLRAWADRPLIGWGLPAPVEGADPAGLQNFYLTVGVGFGLVGLGGFAVLAIVLAHGCWRAVRERVWPATLGLALFAVGCAVAVMLVLSVQVDTLASRSGLIMLMALLMAAGFERLWWRDAVVAGSVAVFERMPSDHSRWRLVRSRGRRRSDSRDSA